MACYALIGIFLGIFGSYLLLRTLLYTRDAAQAANDTMGVARDTLTETKSNSRRELRAYLAIHIVAKNINETNGVPTIYIRFQNRGISPAMGIRLRILEGMGADETIEKRASIQPNDIEEIEWPLEDLDMEDERGEEYFKIRVEYSDIYSGDRWVQADFFVMHQFDFPTTMSVSGRDGGRIINPDYIAERKIQFRYYTDDLQEEASEYAESNQPTQ